MLAQTGAALQLGRGGVNLQRDNFRRKFSNICEVFQISQKFCTKNLKFFSKELWKFFRMFRKKLAKIFGKQQLPIYSHKGWWGLSRKGSKIFHLYEKTLWKKNCVIIFHIWGRFFNFTSKCNQ